MKTRIAILNTLVILSGLTLTGCSWFGPDEPPKPQMQQTAFSVKQQAGPIFRIQNRNNPEEVIMFARSLSKAGRYKESAGIYLDAARRFKSSSGNFELDCKMAAVREYWLAGNLLKANELLDQLEKEQDIYNRASESDEIRRLRNMLRESEEIKKQAAAN